MEWQPLILSFKLALVSTLILLVVGVLVAHWLAYNRSSFRPVIAAITNLPLVLPPTVLGFYLLLAFSPNHGFGKFIDELFGISLVFSFEGLVVASVLYSLPFMVQPIESGFRGLPEAYRESSAVMGKSWASTLWKVLIPNIRPSIITGIVLSFAHTLGEFGVILMIGGNIPGVTRVASIAIYDEVESMNYQAAHNYSLILISTTFLVLLLVYYINGQYKRKEEV